MPSIALARAPAREEDAVVVVEDDDRLAALLDECPPANRLGVHRQLLTQRLRNAFVGAHGAQTHMSVNPSVLYEGEMR